MKRSIEKRLVWVFAAALVLIIAACMFLSYRIAYNNELQRNRTVGRSAAYMTRRLLDDVGLDLLLEPHNSGLYDYTRAELRTICTSLQLSYMYVYRLDDTGKRYYVMTVATDDEIDAIVEKSLGLGTTSGEPIREQELAAARGDMSDEYLILNNQYGKMVTWITPYIDRNGQPAALIGTDVSMQLHNNAIEKQFLALFMPVCGVLIAAFVLLFLHIRRKVVRPLHAVAERMERFDPETEEEPLEIGTKDEIQQIADAFGKMSSEIRTYIGNIASITKEQEYERAQLDAARRIQYGMVPASYHSLKNGLDVSGRMHPAKEVGGDFYDCFALHNGQICVLIADVSGKSIAGALFMALAKNLVRDRIMQFEDPAEALNSVNDELCAQNPEGMFVTVFAMLVDPKTGTVRFSNAGHNPPLLLKDGSASYLKPKPGIALGLFEDAGLETETIRLSKNDGILLYTDGVTEAVNKDRAFFGKERLLALMNETHVQDSETAVQTVTDSVAAFYEGCDQFDDITVVAAYYLETDERTPLAVSLDAFDTVKSEILTKSAGSPKAKKIVLACEEAFVNIVRYSTATEADCRVTRNGDVLTAEFRDNGVRFDPLTKTLKEDDDFMSMDEGGLGIRFYRSIASDVQWDYADGRNILTLSFAL